MIFVTVGTHEQSFNRLVEYMDNWAKNHEEKVIIQTGYSTYVPKYAEWSKIFSYQEMVNKVKNARIIITHGGPSSFIMPLQIGKTPIVVPRKHEYNEHVNNHQVDFAKAVEKRIGTIKVVEDEKELEYVIGNYNSIVSCMTSVLNSNNVKFNEELEKIVYEMFEEGN